MLSYLKAVTAGSVVSVIIILFLHRFVSFSRTLFIIDWFLLFMFLAGSRLSFRNWIRNNERRRSSLFSSIDYVSSMNCSWPVADEYSSLHRMIGGPNPSGS